MTGAKTPKAAATNNYAIHSIDIARSLGEVYVWIRALSAAEIAANCDVDLAGKQAGRLASYRLDERAGRSLY